MFTLDGKVVLLTGALGGIGKCFVRELLKNGVKGIALLDINDEHADSFQKEIRNEFGDGKTFFVKVDLTDAEQIEGAYEKTIQHFKQLDIVINNAGMIQPKFLKSLMTNFVATSYSTHLAFTKYLESNRIGEEGVVINVSSIAGLHSFPLFPPYCASKTGVVALGRCLGDETHYNAKKIKIMTICPGSTDTPIVDQLSEGSTERKPEVDEIFKEFPLQRPENVATALIGIIKNGKTGSIWVVKQDKPAIEVDFSEIDKIIYNYVV